MKLVQPRPRQSCARRRGVWRQAQRPRTWGSELYCLLKNVLSYSDKTGNKNGKLGIQNKIKVG